MKTESDKKTSGIPKRMTREQAIAKWVKALRSGEYKQTKGTLAKVVGRRIEYCCLGVAEKVIPGGEMKSEYIKLPNSCDKKVIFFVRGIGEHQTRLTPELADFLGVTVHARVTIPGIGVYFLSELNDNGGFTFDQIADIIEAGFLDNIKEINATPDWRL